MRLRGTQCYTLANVVHHSGCFWSTACLVLIFRFQLQASKTSDSEAGFRTPSRTPSLLVEISTIKSRASSFEPSQSLSFQPRDYERRIFGTFRFQSGDFAIIDEWFSLKLDSRGLDERSALELAINYKHWHLIWIISVVESIKINFKDQTLWSFPEANALNANRHERCRPGCPSNAIPLNTIDLNARSIWTLSTCPSTEMLSTWSCPVPGRFWPDERSAWKGCINHEKLMNLKNPKVI